MNVSKSSTSEDLGDTMARLDLFKKFKLCNPLEPSLGIVGFFMIVLLLISCFFYLDYGAALTGLRSRRVPFLGLHFSSSFSPSSLVGGARVEFLDKEGDGCDVFDGNWLWDESYPLYHSTNCSFLDQGFRCSENGRPDSFYTKWRWQPKFCNLPRFLFSPTFTFHFPIAATEKMTKIFIMNFIIFFVHTCLATTGFLLNGFSITINEVSAHFVVP